MDGTALSEVSQLQKDKYCMIPLYEESKIVRLPEAGNRMAVARESGGGEIGKLMFNVYKVTPPKKNPQQKL